MLGVHPGSTPKRWFHQQLSFADPELGAAAPVLALQLSPDYKTHHSEVGRCSWARRLASMRTRGGHLPPTAVNRSHESTATLPRSDSPPSLIRWAPQEKCRGCTCSRRKIPPKQKPGGGREMLPPWPRAKSSAPNFKNDNEISRKHGSPRNAATSRLPSVSLLPFEVLIGNPILHP